ncbi:hypothetical protein DN068_21850 [Taibaiella soli]|uniref:Uncharacterized protein n=1 Tax=Taibaiella soli TaxID=1649169 RepID=A0A2W2AB02_9BACT|nr:hypothetical protein DN068_21850 [Taibaiella soli]
MKFIKCSNQVMLFVLCLLLAAGCNVVGKRKVLYTVYYPGYILGSYRLEAKDWTTDVQKGNYHFSGTIVRAGTDKILDSIVIAVVKGGRLLPIGYTDSNGKFDIRGKRNETIRFSRKNYQPVFILLSPSLKKKRPPRSTWYDF